MASRYFDFQACHLFFFCICMDRQYWSLRFWMLATQEFLGLGAYLLHHSRYDGGSPEIPEFIIRFSKALSPIRLLSGETRQKKTVGLIIKAEISNHDSHVQISSNITKKMLSQLQDLRPCQFDLPCPGHRL